MKLIHLQETEIDQVAIKYDIKKSGNLTDNTINAYTSLTKYVKLIHLPELEILKIALKLREITSNKLISKILGKFIDARISFSSKTVL